MTTSDDRGMVDSSLLNIFRSDVSMHRIALESNLLSLKDNPGAAQCLDALVDATFSLRGTALIVGLDAVADFAGAMHRCLCAAGKGPASLQPEHIDMLLKASGLLGGICEASDEEAVQWAATHRSKIDEVLAFLGQVTIPQKDLEPQAPLPAKADPPLKPLRNSAAAMIDPMMLDIFRTEVGACTQALNEGLLLLESESGAAGPEAFDSLMRAAHSIKGAGRIVDLDLVVKVAHAMEDCFVAAGKGAIQLLPPHIDILLKSVDILAGIAGTADKGPTELDGDVTPERVDELVSAIRAICTGAFELETVPTIPAIPAVVDITDVTEARAISPAFLSPSHSDPDRSGGAGAERKVSIPERPRKEPSGKDPMIRVAATKIERLIGLAGEVVVNTRWLPVFSDSLLSLKKEHMEVAAILDRLQGASAEGSQCTKADDLIREAREKIRGCGLLLTDRTNWLSNFVSNTGALSDRLYQESVGVRMRPFAEGGDVRGLPRMVRDLARRLGKKVRLEIVGRSTEVDRDILEKLDAPLNHLLRNAVDHGIELPEERRAAGKPETGVLRLQVEHRAGMLMIRISDDGRGIDPDWLKKQIIGKGLASAELVERLSESELMDFLFLPGFSTADKVSEISGRGVGLDVVHTKVHEVGGIVRAFSRPGEGIVFLLELPLTLSVVRTLLIDIAGESYAFPLVRIDRCLLISRDDIQKVEERQYFRYDGRNIALVNIHHVLEMAEPTDSKSVMSVLVVSDRTDAYGLVVDKLLGECDMVVRPLDPRLGKVANFSAASLLLDGTPVLIFDVDDLIRSVVNQLGNKRLSYVAALGGEAGEKVRKHILVVDDSITVRELERKMLEHLGYRVDVAVDGMDGWNAVRSGRYSMVVSDIDMPRMNGIEMIGHIRQHPDFKSLPVVIVSYKDNEEDRLAGLQAGADYYLTKSSFQDRSFINAVVDLIGDAGDTDHDS